MAMKHARWVVYGGAMLALIVMTVLAVTIGWVLPFLIPVEYTHYAAGVLFFGFGVKLLWEAKDMESGVSEELAEVEEELAKKDGVDLQSDDLELGDRRKARERKLLTVR
eukprot:UN28182